jgi:hypothetical protein
VLLVDKTKGLLSGALLERGVSEIMNFEFSQQYKKVPEILQEFNFAPEQTQKV